MKLLHLILGFITILSGYYMNIAWIEFIGIILLVYGIFKKTNKK
jgi:hypothetical protein